MDYIPHINEYISGILTSKDPYNINIKSDDNYLYVEIVMTEYETIVTDVIFLKLSRDIKRKGHYLFRNGCPGGKYELTEKLKRDLIKCLSYRKLFSEPLKKGRSC